MKFSITDFFSKCDQLVTFTEEICDGKIHFLCSVGGFKFLNVLIYQIDLKSDVAFTNVLLVAFYNFQTFCLSTNVLSGLKFLRIVGNVHSYTKFKWHIMNE